MSGLRFTIARAGPHGVSYVMCRYSSLLIPSDDTPAQKKDAS